MTLKPRTYQVIPLISRAGYRRWIWPWWKHWLDPRTYWYDLITFYQRGRRGWADRDLWSLDLYLAGWMGDALHKMQEVSPHMNKHTKQGIREFQQMIEGWDAAGKVMDSFGTDKQALRRWERGFDIFKKRFFSLWT